jgi:hypothetical protein
MQQVLVGEPAWTVGQFLTTGPEGLRTLYESRPRRSRDRWGLELPRFA